MDPEARDTATATGNPQYGKVREALLRYTEWARAFTAQSRTGSFDLGTTEDPIYGLGEMWLRSPTVFNWFAPGYTPPDTTISAAGLLAPEMQMTNVSTVVGYINYMQSAIGANATWAAPTSSRPTATEMSLAATPNQLLDRINLLLMAGQMSSTLYNQILAAVNAIPIPTGRSERNQCRASEPRANGNLSHRGVARLRRAAIGASNVQTAIKPAGSFSERRPWPPWPAST